MSRCVPMATKKSSGSKYGPSAGKSVEREMKAMKQGKLKSGSGQKVTNPKQAIAIGLSEARKAGGKVPAAKKAAGTRSAAKKTVAKKAPAKKSSTKKAAKKSAAKKSAR